MKNGRMTSLVKLNNGMWITLDEFRALKSRTIHEGIKSLVFLALFTLAGFLMFWACGDMTHWGG